MKTDKIFEKIEERKAWQRDMRDCFRNFFLQHPSEVFSIDEVIRGAKMKIPIKKRLIGMFDIFDENFLVKLFVRFNTSGSITINGSAVTYYGHPHALENLKKELTEKGIKFKYEKANVKKDEDAK